MTQSGRSPKERNSAQSTLFGDSQKTEPFENAEQGTKGDVVETIDD